MAGRALLLALGIVGGCAAADRSPAPDSVAGARDGPDTTLAFLADTVAQGGGEDDVPRLDSLRVEMSRLEQLLADAPDAGQPPLLLELGRVKRMYVAPYDGPHADYARSRPDEYMYDEIGGRFVYLGTHLRALIDRYPAHPLADDAAWQLTLLTPSGECEGFITCYVAYRWWTVRGFLQGHGSSPYAAHALDRAIAGFRESLDSVTDLTRPAEYYEPSELHPIVADFDSVTAGLPAGLRDSAAAFSSALRRRLGRP